MSSSNGKTSSSFKSLTRSKPSVSSKSAPLESFNGSRAIWITPFACRTGRVKIVDLTPCNLPFGTNEDEDYEAAKAKAADLAESSDAAPPAWTFRRTGFWKNIVIYEGDPPPNKQEGIVAVWNPPKWDLGLSVFTFPHQSSETKETYPTHTITLKKDRPKRTECFVSDSFQYIWRWDNVWAGRCLSLFRVINGEEVQVARYKGQKPWRRHGGLLLIDESEVDAALAMIGCVSTLRKDLIRRR